MDKKDIIKSAENLFVNIKSLNDNDKIDLINNLRILLHGYSPFKNEPVDCVLWIPSSKITSNDYNPNKVAPPEMKLLEHSIREDGYTQPIVAWENNDNYEVIDGFHRNRVGKEVLDINARIKNYLPITVTNTKRNDRKDRIAATIRHNRARGKHVVEGMSDIILELKNRNWSNDRIARELGMDQDEILRLCQITGLAALFEDQEFSKAWDIENLSDEFNELNDDISAYDEEEINSVRTANTKDENRIFHNWDKWECYKAGFYKTTIEGKTRGQCEKAYRDLLSDPNKFAIVLNKVINEWKNSCEHYLTNSAMNRIAWLGQAALCYNSGIPSTYRNGFNLLDKQQQKIANETALIYLNKWLSNNNRPQVSMDEALGHNRQVDLY